MFRNLMNDMIESILEADTVVKDYNRQDWQTEYSERIFKNCKREKDIFCESDLCEGEVGVHVHAQVSSVQFSKLNNRMKCGKNFTRFK